MIILKFSYKYAILLFITKKFLWTNGVEITKKHLLAWEKVCLPRTAGDCALCDRACETTDHLFFFCEFAKYICSKILQWQVLPWQEELSWACIIANRKRSRNTIYRMSVTATVYHVWIERNQRICQGKSSPPQLTTRKIVQRGFL